MAKHKQCLQWLGNTVLTWRMVSLVSLLAMATCTLAVDSSEFYSPQRLEDLGLSTVNGEMKGSTVMTKVTRLYYLSFASGTDPGSVSKTEICPRGAIFVNASAAVVKSFRGIPIPAGTGQVHMWQCQMNVPVWVSKNEQDNEKEKFDLRGIDKNLNSVESAFNQNTPTWELYNRVNGSRYTGFQFPNNAFIPAGIAGSGIACPGAGGTIDLQCKPSATGPLLKVYEDQKEGIRYIYLDPAGKAFCTVKRTYANSEHCDADKGGQFELEAGTAWVGACCHGNWKSTKASLDDKSLTECGACPT